MSTLIQFKRGKRGDWGAKNPVLVAGEPGYEYPEWDTKGYLESGGLKIGGTINNEEVTHWNDLPYINKFIVTYSSIDDFPRGDVKLINRSCLYRDEKTEFIYYYSDYDKDYI